MDFFNYQNGELYCENVPAARLAQEFGTPAYIYSKATLLRHYRQVADAFKALNPTICFSIKSCGNINLCRILANEGCGFDVTSGGELYRALQAGGEPSKIIYAGVGKTDDEIRFAPRQRHRGLQHRIRGGTGEHRPHRRPRWARAPSAPCA